MTTKAHAAAKPATGPLTWRALLQWLREDRLIGAEDATRTAQRFSSGDSRQHPLVRLASAGLVRESDGAALDAEALTQWLAARCGLPYLRIDPLKVDVGRVADVMSINYAERRHALPIQVGTHEVTIATCEPFDIGWVAEIEGHTRKKCAWSLPPGRAAATGFSHSRARCARRSAARRRPTAASGNSSSSAGNRRWTPTTRAWCGSSAGVAVRFDQRASDIHLEPRGAAGRDPLPHRRRDAHRLPAAAGRDEP
ncbi:MAG: hypothetical protein IPG91_01260 [Ideonella sp.]|nr:hypothetical protein [Ideonella sp.]